MNVLRGSLNQNRRNRRNPPYRRKNFDILPIFETIRPRISTRTPRRDPLPSNTNKFVETVADDESYQSVNNNLLVSDSRFSVEPYYSSTADPIYDEDVIYNTCNSVGTNFSVAPVIKKNFPQNDGNEFITTDESYTIGNCNKNANVREPRTQSLTFSSKSVPSRNYESYVSKKSIRENNSPLSSILNEGENVNGGQMFNFEISNQKAGCSKTNIMERNIFSHNKRGDCFKSLFGKNQSPLFSENGNQELAESTIIENVNNHASSAGLNQNLLNGDPVRLRNCNPSLTPCELNSTDADPVFRTPVYIPNKTSTSQSVKNSTNSNSVGATCSNTNRRIRDKEEQNYLASLTPLLRDSNINTKEKINILRNNIFKNISDVTGKQQNDDSYSFGRSSLNSIEPPQLVSKILQTPDVNRHLILPLLTSSSERRDTAYHTPVTKLNQVQALLPLNDFSESGKKNRLSSSSGPQPCTTPSDRLRTPKSTNGSNESTQQVILAIAEGRGLARGEVGIAVMDVKRPRLILCQISDSQTYTNTLTKINYFNPIEILVPHTFVESQQTLFGLLNDYFPNASLTTVLRRHFNDKIGLSQVLSLCLPEYSSVELIIKHKFYALSAAAALLKFVEFSQTVLFSKRSIKVEYQGAEDMMTIDLESAKQLELVLCNSGGGCGRSLFGILNHCSTISGRRSLRANILQPPNNLLLTMVRLNCVTELVGDPNLLACLKRALVKFEDVEQLLWLCMQLPNLNMTDKPSETQMNFILLLKTTLMSLPDLVDTLKDAQAPYFHDSLMVLKDNRYSSMLKIILENINEDARVVKGFMASQQQRCFAIKPGVNGLLDVARNTYSSLVDETYNKVAALSREYNLPLKLSSSNSKGMHIQINLSQNRYFKIKDLPPAFIQVNRTSKNLVTCTTEEILILNQRMKHALREIQLMSNVIIGEMLHKIREHIGCLHKLCEIVAELDILLSLSLVSSCSDFVRPEFGADLYLEASRHPILDVINPARPVGNDVKASKEKNFHLITGPNMGGKSIYIRQVALLQIMAQIGCYVPAKSAQFCLIRSLFTRIGFDDNIEHNASTFKREICQMNYILQSANKDHTSLIIIDELCRGTSSDEGTAIAWALSKELAQLNAFTFFTTHFQFLSQLERMYPNITNWHFEAEENENGRLNYTHKLMPGPNTIPNYGIQLAQLTSLPESVLKLIDETKKDIDTMNQMAMRNLIDAEKNDVEQDKITILANKFVDLLYEKKTANEIVSDIRLFISDKFSLVSQDDSSCNEKTYLKNSNDVSQNSTDVLCNVEVQLKELDGSVELSHSHFNNENFTTQECVNMLCDNTSQTINESFTLINGNADDEVLKEGDSNVHESVVNENVDQVVEEILDEDEITHSYCGGEIETQQNCGKYFEENEKQIEKDYSDINNNLNNEEMVC